MMNASCALQDYGTCLVVTWEVILWGAWRGFLTFFQTYFFSLERETSFWVVTFFLGKVISSFLLQILFVEGTSLPLEVTNPYHLFLP